MMPSIALIFSVLIVASTTATIDAFPSVGVNVGVRVRGQVKVSKQVKVQDSFLHQSFFDVEDESSSGCDDLNLQNSQPNCHNHLVVSRTKFLSTAGMMLTAATATFTPTSTANAAYGDTSNLELPNYIEFLIEKNTQTDPTKILYKGADIDVQIKRISDAAARLNEIPKIAQEKKWSQVQGILTGPLGTLVQTMNALCKETTEGSGKSSAAASENAKKAAAKVKGDIILISQEAAKKNETGVIKACELAQKDLESFAKLVF